MLPGPPEMHSHVGGSTAPARTRKGRILMNFNETSERRMCKSYLSKLDCATGCRANVDTHSEYSVLTIQF